MNQVELLRHVADNLEAGRDELDGITHHENYILRDITNFPEMFRIKVKRHKVNNFTVPAPLTEPPANGTYYYIASIHSDDCFLSAVWDGHPLDNRYLRRRLIHLTKAAAQQNALAMLGRDPDLGVEDV